MFFDDNLMKLREDKKNLKVEIDSMIDEEKREIEESKKEIEQKYIKIKEERWDEFSNLNGKIINECELIQMASTFNLEEISEIIANLISVYENEAYVVKTVSYRVDNGALFNDAKVIINKKNLGIFSKEIKEPQFNSLAKNGIVIPFVKGFSKNNFPETIKFYEADSTNLNTKISFRKHVYAKEFIDFVITYRVKNNVLEISFEALEELLAKFIYYNFDKIQKYHNYKDECKRKEFEAYIQREKEERAKVIKRMLKKYNLEQ